MTSSDLSKRLGAVSVASLLSRSMSSKMLSCSAIITGSSCSLDSLLPAHSADLLAPLSKCPLHVGFARPAQIPMTSFEHM
eukprot:4262377-Pyramimonas_sp.AAC.2